MNTTPREPAPDGATQLDEALLDRALRPRDLDFEAAYTVLGKQYPVERWVAVLNHLAQHARNVDLELVAHSTLRRPPGVIKAVLGLARAKGTAQAAFLARVIAQARTEGPLVADANALNADIKSPFDLDVQLAAGDSIGALYFLLASPLDEQVEELRRLSPDPAFAELAETMRSEYKRLQEVSKDTRWRSGSYRHVLRHGLADMALIARIGGQAEDQAFRLLQLRTDDFAAELVVAAVSNALVVAVRAERRALDDAQALLRTFVDSPLVLHATTPLAPPALELAATTRLSAYDSFYAVLARSLDIPLVTADRRLADAVPGSLLVA